MNIPLDENYRLSSDKYQWMIQKRIFVKDKETGEKVETWKSQNFHPTPEGAIRHHANMRVREQEAETLTEALEKIENVVSKLSDALKLNFEIKTPMDFEVTKK